MNLSELPSEELTARLRRDEVVLRIGPFVARVGTTLRELVAPLRLLYGDFPLETEEQITDFVVRLAPPPSVRRWVAPQVVAYVDGRREFAPFPRRHSLPMLEWILNWCIFSRPNQYFILHAAVVERDGRGLLLSGSPGSGKSTLCAGLVSRGWRLLSDEVAMTRPGNGRILPVPRPISLKEESIAVLSGFASEAQFGPASHGTRKGRVAHMQPPTDSVRRADETATPAWLLFPTYDPGVSVELDPVPRAAALLRAAEQSFNYSLLGEVGFETLAAIIDTVDCYEFRYGELDAAVRSLGSLELPRASVSTDAGLGCGTR